MSTLDDGLLGQKKPSSNSKRRLIIWTIVLLMGLLFRLLRWPLAGELILIASGGILASSIDSYLRLPSERKAMSIFIGLGLIWNLILAWANIFNEGFPFNWIGFAINISSASVFLIIYSLQGMRRRR
jgi:hypothetical protein